MTQFLRLVLSTFLLGIFPMVAFGQPPAVAFERSAPRTETENVRGATIKLVLLQGDVSWLMVVQLAEFNIPGPDWTFDEVVQAIDLLLSRMEAKQPLPARFTIQLGSLGSIVMPLLQAQVSLPGSNWNTRTGNARHGTAYAALPREALAAIANTPLAQVFTRRGYRLMAGSSAQRVDVGQVNGRGDAHLPIWVGYLPVDAVRE